MKKIILKNIAEIEASPIDKKSKENEKVVKLCNFTDVYKNWRITSETASDFMTATASDKQIERFSLHKGQVAITKDSETRDDIGISTSIADNLPNTVLGYHCILISPNEKLVNSEYLNLFMHTKYAHKYFEANASGSGQRFTLTNQVIEDMPILMLDFNDQIKLSSFFVNINDIIENNRKIVEELSNIISMIYFYWFYQFDFPDKDGRPYKTSGGEMIYDEKLEQEIPKGWRVTELGDIIEEKSKSPTQVNKAKESPGDFPFFTSGNEILNFNEYYVDGFNIFLNTGGNAGVKAYFGKAAYSSDTWCISAKEYTYILYIFLDSIIEQINNNYFAGSGLKHLQKDIFKKIKLVVPEKELLHSFNEFAQSLFQAISLYKLQNKELASLRDWLLPMLMNGQVIIKD